MKRRSNLQMKLNKIDEVKLDGVKFMPICPDPNVYSECQDTNLIVDSLCKVSSKQANMQNPS